ncbi:hypothetical protein [Anabaena azotica]|uniref:hypothetical protein n=1 Tax=Anabaena azotica TaxID=197653 RepID=UPI0039A4BC03
MKSNIISLSIASIVGFSTLLVSSAVPIHNNRVIAQTEKPSTTPSNKKFVCKDSQVVELYNQIKDLNIRTSIDKNYEDFRKAFIDIKLQFNKVDYYLNPENFAYYLRNIKKEEENFTCFFVVQALQMSINQYDNARIFWNDYHLFLSEEFGENFISVNNASARRLLKEKPDIVKTYFNGKAVSVSSIIDGYFALAKDWFNKINKEDSLIYVLEVK